MLSLEVSLWVVQAVLGFRKKQLKESVHQRSLQPFAKVSLCVCLFGVLVLRCLAAFSKRAQGAGFRTFKGIVVIQFFEAKRRLRESEEEQWGKKEHKKELQWTEDSVCMQPCMRTLS